nr:MAG TPA: hypothetical protein [Caudoviricetes sp.]
MEKKGKDRISGPSRCQQRRGCQEILRGHQPEVLRLKPCSRRVFQYLRLCERGHCLID